MRGECISYGDVVVYPEYCGYSLGALITASEGDERLRIASLSRDNENIAVVLRNRELLYRRAKYRLHQSEIERGLHEGTQGPEVVSLGGKRVLILICYEMVFPEDYMLLGSVDLVVHLVGQPMFSEEQREGWIALQRAISLTYKCPVVCCCGGRKGRMNITGVVEV